MVKRLAASNRAWLHGHMHRTLTRLITPAGSLFAAFALLWSQNGIEAREYHVSIRGNDSAPGTKSAPLRTIQRAADLAQPGDIITVHEGVYRERINPPRGGTSDKNRIVYQAAAGEKVEIKGSELIKHWEKVQEDVWKVTIPNAFFGGFNPYTNLIHGDWFNPRGREHHTGAIYLDGEWLTEATRREEVLMPPGSSPAWLNQSGQYLLNVAWLRPDGAPGAGRVPATGYAAHAGTQKAECSEGGECLGFIEHGHWVTYDGLEFGTRSERIEVRAASATEGGLIEIRADGPGGELLGSCSVPNTGGWQAWSSFEAPIKPVGGKRTICLVFKGKSIPPLNRQLWFAQVDDSSTTLWAQFRGLNPNERLVEINTRKTVFYPDQPGRNFITVRGFTMRHAATPWAPPTAQQMGLIGTHWSKGWLIEDNVISHSICSGIALGKYRDQWDNTSANTAEGYVKTIERALQNGWNKETIGHHVVRNNTISYCEQAGIVGSLGAAFSTVTGNTIHDIHVRRLFSGAEMAGIKFHAAIDTVISGNHIYRTCLGLWLDWMAQGTRVSGNLFHDNAGQDMFVEVDHGPFMVDNNLFLSPVSLLDMSEGGAYAHNLFNGRLTSRPEPGRETPYHPAHTTKVAGLTTIKGGDDRFYNNIFVGKGTAEQGKPAARDGWDTGFGLSVYDRREYPLETGGNVYFNGAQPYCRESSPVQVTGDPKLRLVQAGEQLKLEFGAGADLRQGRRTVVTTQLLGKAKVPQVQYENADGTPLSIIKDYFGNKRGANPTPGPFENPGKGLMVLSRSGAR